MQTQLSGRLEPPDTTNERKTLARAWDNHPIERYTPHMMKQKINYVNHNPEIEGIVEHPHEYLYTSAWDYAEIPGLLKVTAAEF